MRVSRSGSHILFGHLPEQTIDADGGIWKIKKLVWYAVVSGALYDGGWTKIRPPEPRKPGSIPPGDAPSTIPDLKVYPEVYMPPYHYKNPVTGK